MKNPAPSSGFLGVALAISFAMVGCRAGCQTFPVSQSGLVVGQPKVYDNYYLQQQLQTMKLQLEALQLFGGSTLTGKIGNVQGATLNQLGVALQAGGPPTPSTKSITGTTPSNEADMSSVTAPTPTVSSTALALPTPSIGSTDTLREMVQLQAQINGLELLLDGALSDKIEADGKIRRVLTLGFPISIRPPNETNFHSRANSVAVIDVSLCHVSEEIGNDLSLVTLLPRERTYDVAGLSEHSLSASAGAVLGGVVSVGGGFLRKKQKYYMMQEQETVAFQNERASCPDASQVGTSFTWAIRPVLGNTQVRPGMQDGFVQFAMKNAPQGKSSITACMRVGWAHQSKHNAVLKELPKLEGASCIDVPNLYTGPEVTSVRVHNAAGGSLQVHVEGSFLPGFQVRAGQSVLPAAAVVPDPSGKALDIQVAAADLLKGGGLTIVGRNGESVDVELKAPAELHKMGPVTQKLTPYSDTLTRVTLDFDQPYDPDPAGAFNELRPGGPFEDPWVVILGGTVYGLKDAPFTAYRVSAGLPATRHIELIVPTISLVNSSPIELRRLLWQADKVVRVLDRTEFATISKTVPLSGADGVKLMLLGKQLDELKVIYPIACSLTNCLTDVNPSSAIITLDAATAKDVKQIVFCQAKGGTCDKATLPILLDIASAVSTTVKLSLTATSMPHGSTTVTIAGTAAKSVIGMKYADKAIPVHLADGKLVLDLSGSTLPQSDAGDYPIVVAYADQTTSVYVLTIK